MKPAATSVVITAHNYGRFIEEAIESVLSQDYPADRMEVLVVDDGSTDDTAERVRNYGARIRYFYMPNRGQASALNLGFGEARGEIIAMLDADDYWLPGKLRRIVEEFKNRPEVGMIYHPFLEVDMESNERRISPSFVAVSGSFAENKREFFWYAPPGTSASIRRKVLERVLPIPEEIRMLADGYVNALIPFLTPVLGIPEPLSVYRVHGKNSYYAAEGQMPMEVRKSRLESRQILLDAKRKWLANNGFTRKQPPVRAFLDRWRLYQEADEFQLGAPGRWRYFSHLMLYNRCYGPHLSRRLRMINRVNALGALVVGYKHFHLLEKWRLAAVAGVKRAFRGGEARGERAL